MVGSRPNSSNSASGGCYALQLEHLPVSPEHIQLGLLRQVELALFLVFEGVQRALPAVGIPVGTLDARLVHHCWHGCSPLVRSTTANMERPARAVSLRRASAIETGGERKPVLLPVVGPWQNCLLRVSRLGRIVETRSPTEELRAISLAGAAALEGD